MTTGSSNNEKSDILCWYCERFFDSRDIEWKPRKYVIDEWVLSGGDKPNEMTEEMKQKAKILEKEIGNEKQSSPNKIFGGIEYEYRGKCPNCNVEQTCFWLGKESISRNRNVKIERKPFACNSCKHLIEREFQVWYSIRTKDKYEVEREYFVTVCPMCRTQIEYPYKYDLDYGNIE